MAYQAAERIKSVRETFRLNRTEFAQILGLSISIISLMESGKTLVSEKTVTLLERTFLINPDWLYNGVGGMFSREDVTVESVLEMYPTVKKLYEIRQEQQTVREMMIRNRLAWKEQRERAKLYAEENKRRSRLVRREQTEKARREAGDRMKKFRSAFQLNQNQLAQRIGYTRAYVSAVEKGIQKPSARMVELIEAEFGISAAWLLNGTAANTQYAMQ